MNALDITARRELVAKERPRLTAFTVTLDWGDVIAVDVTVLCDVSVVEATNGNDPDSGHNALAHTIVWVDTPLPLNRDEACAMFDRRAIEEAEAQLDEQAYEEGRVAA